MPPCRIWLTHDMLSDLAHSHACKHKRFLIARKQELRARKDATTISLLYYKGTDLSEAHLGDLGLAEQMQVLDLRCSRALSALSCCIADSDLRFLDLSYSSLTALPFEVVKLPVLEVLRLRRCPDLTDLPGGLAHMPTLR